MGGAYRACAYNYIPPFTVCNCMHISLADVRIAYILEVLSCSLSLVWYSVSISYVLGNRTSLGISLHIESAAMVIVCRQCRGGR